VEGSYTIVIERNGRAEQFSGRTLIGARREALEWLRVAGARVSQVDAITSRRAAVWLARATETELLATSCKGVRSFGCWLVSARKGD